MAYNFTKELENLMKQIEKYYAQGITAVQEEGARQQAKTAESFAAAGRQSPSTMMGIQSDIGKKTQQAVGEMGMKKAESMASIMTQLAALEQAKREAESAKQMGLLGMGASLLGTVLGGGAGGGLASLLSKLFKKKKSGSSSWGDFEDYGLNLYGSE